MLDRIKQTDLFINLFGSLGRELRPAKWVFILGCYNSGTTLLAKMIGSHPQVGGLPGEGISFTSKLPHPEQFGWPRMWCECEKEMSSKTAALTARDARKIKKHWSFRYPEGRDILVEKSISDVTRIPYLMHHFSPAYFIIMRRNGYAVSEGIQRRAKLAKWHNPVYEEAYPIELCARQWRRTYEVIDEHRPEMNHILDISYEELMSDPEQALAGISDFLNIQPFPEETISREWSFQDISSRIKNLNSGSLERLTADQKKAIFQEAGPLLEKWGYE